MRWRRTEITVETQQWMILRKTSDLVQAVCPQCPEESKLISPESAALITGVGIRVIYNLVETGAIHFVETHLGSVLICLNSLLRLCPNQG